MDIPVLKGARPMRKSSQGIPASDAWPLSMNRLGLQLLEKVRRDQPSRNLLLSPCSLAFCLAVAYSGAAGRTKAELAEILGLTGVTEEEAHDRFRALRTELGQPGPQLELLLATAIWANAQTAFSADFLQRVHDSLDAEPRTLDAADPGAAQIVDRWVSNKTNGRIPSLVSPADLSRGTGCVLTNAVYFKGAWEVPFDGRATRDRPFTLADGRRQDVPMMHRVGRYSYLATETFQAIALAYAGDRLRMHIILPREGVSGEPSDWEAWLPQLRPARVELALPRFSTTCALDMVRPLSELGRLAFQPGADFTRMGLAGHFISSLKHSVRLDVSEEGTEAAGASAVVMGRRLTPVVSMIVDRPFLLAIHDDRSRALLFLGRVAEPQPTR
jgi:serine protease inhibitor